MHLVTYGVCTDLCHLLKQDVSPTASHSAAAALHNLAQSADVRKKMATEIDFAVVVEAARPNPSAEVTAREPKVGRGGRGVTCYMLHVIARELLHLFLSSFINCGIKSEYTVGKSRRCWLTQPASCNSTRVATRRRVRAFNAWVNP